MTTPELTVGSTFHAWKLDRVLARGGSGTVYHATHRLTRRPAAIKVITPPRGSTTNEATIARFHTELELHLTLRLANLPDFYDAELTPEGTAVLVLELLDGTDLAQLLSRAGPLSAADALFVASELLRTLQPLHRVGVHRDIKPSNLFVRRRARLDSEGRVEKRRVTLLDFGIAKVKERPGVTKQNTVVGTPCYMSPEQLRGQPVDARTDLYATGALLYEMLSGRPPYVDDRRKLPSAGELILAHGTQPLVDLREVVPDLPEEVAAFVRTLLAKDPAGRYPSAESAFAVASALLARHSGGAKRFREEIDGGTSEPLPPAAPTIIDEPIDFDDAAPPTEVIPATTVVSVLPTGPASLETERLDTEGDPLDPWEERQLAAARRLLRAPRVFRSAAVANVDPTTGAILGLRPLQAIESRIGSGPDAAVRVIAPDVLAHHATLRTKPDGRIELELAPDAVFGRGLTIDTATTAAGQIVHGTRFRCGPLELQIVDRAIVDPSASVPPRRRTRAPILTHVTRATGRLGNIKIMKQPLALIGSLPACDLVVPGATSIRAAVWLRGDGELELAEIDVSVLPLGQPVMSARLLGDGEEIDLGHGEMLRVEQPL